jgi:hypothetical protein
MGIERVLLRVSSAIGSYRRRPAGETLIVPGRPAIWVAIVYADIISSQGKLEQLVRLYTDKWAVMSNWTVYLQSVAIPWWNQKQKIRRVTDDQVERKHSTVKTKTRQSHDIYLSGSLNRMAFSFLSLFFGGSDSLSIESFTRISSSPFPKRTSTSLELGCWMPSHCSTIREFLFPHRREFQKQQQDDQISK